MATQSHHRGRRLLFACIALALPALARAQQPVDSAYTARIREFTTEPFFLTPLVDHLPASERVPTPLAFLGHIAGARDVLTYPEDIYRYLRAVAAATPRVRVLSIGQTEEGREQVVAIVADEQTMARLDDYRGMLARLADPRRTTAAEAERLVREAKPVYWATGAIHSPETGSPEMLMELVYRLAVEETPYIQAIRNHLITMVTPVIEVDGRAKVVDLQVARKQDPKTTLPRSPVYWGKYVAHDNNRDNIGLGLQLSRNVLRHFLAWNPTVLHDLHESASYLYTSTGRGPYNAWIDPVLISEWYRLAHREVEELTGWGVPGIYTFDYYDGWSPNYLLWIANMRNSIGRFYETQGAGDASDRIVRASVDRQWSRPNTPLPEVVWSIRNNVNLQQSALLVALNEVATNHEEYLRNFWLKSQRAVAKATTEGPAAYVFPASDPRPAQQARLLRLLQLQGIEVQRLAGVSVAGQDTFPAGSYVVRLDQPFARTADMLLDRQYYNPTDPAPYDDVGWTLGPLYNARTVRVESAEILKAAMTPVSGEVRAPPPSWSLTAQKATWPPSATPDASCGCSRPSMSSRPAAGTTPPAASSSRRRRTPATWPSCWPGRERSTASPRPACPRCRQWPRTSSPRLASRWCTPGPARRTRGGCGSGWTSTGSPTTTSPCTRCATTRSCASATTC